MNKKIKKLNLCPHWIEVDDLQECNISKGGLFIPLPQHIETFCLSAHYDRCSHYMRVYGHLLDQTPIESASAGDRRTTSGGDRRTTSAEDRRINPRVSCNYSLYYSPLEEIGQQKESEQKEVKSIDISLGGMRIKSFDEITQQQKMAFNFGPDQDQLSSIAGIGEVQWCKVSPGQGYIAGVSFIFMHEDMKAELNKCICSTPM